LIVWLIKLKKDETSDNIMPKKLIFILFTLLFALQSTSAVMDEYQPHKSGENPMAFDHGHDSNKNNQAKLTSLNVIDKHSSEPLFDGHHCCHCHGVSQFFSRAVNNIGLIINVTMPIEYRFNPKSFLPSPNYRPPRVYS